MYYWKHFRPVVINDELELPEFEITKHVIRRRNISLATGMLLDLHEEFEQINVHL